MTASLTVESGHFTVYAVNTVDEAVELLTGVTAGERGLDGLYPLDTVFGRAAQRREEMAQAVAEWGEEEENRRTISLRSRNPLSDTTDPATRRAPGESVQKSPRLSLPPQPQ